MRFLTRRYILLAICIILTIIMMLNYNPESSTYLRIQSKLLDYTAPIMKTTSSGLFFFSNLSDQINDFFDTYNENEKLKEKNSFLENYFYLYKQLESENNQLKSELHFTRNYTYEYMTAQIIGKSNNASSQQIIIDGGSKQGIKKWQVVVAKNQFIGRVIYVTENTARILLLTDKTSRIPATSLDSRLKFIVAGNDTDYFICKYLDAQPELTVGELVTTSASDPSIPANLIIGSIFKENNIFYVKPTISLETLEFVQILKIEQDAE